MLIPRTLQAEIEHWLDKNKILIVKGSRQVGKTTLLQLIQKNLEDKKKQTFYLSVDQEFSNPILVNSKNLLRYISDQFPNLSESNKLYLFLDEFQYLAQSGFFLKTLFDSAKDKIQVIVSGSSSLDITKNTEFLTGRKIEFYLYPLSHFEFLTYKTSLKLPRELELNDFSKIQEFYNLYKEKLHDYFGEFASFGGYPEVITTTQIEDKIRLLKELIRTYIEKDIIAFLRIENVTAFQNLLKVLGDQIGNLVNKSELSNTINLSMDTLNKYLDILEGTYVIELVKPYFTNIRKQISKMPKVYMNDLGFRNIMLNKQLPLALINGPERENIVYNILKQKFDRDQIKFYRTISKAEIDFILELPGGIIPIEVKSTKKIIKVPRPMQDMGKKHGIIITDDLLEKTKDCYYLPLVLLDFIKFY